MTDIPQILGGRYEVGELIGRGGMAEVHLGRDRRLSRTVAIKVLRSDLATDPTFLARFRREAQSAAALNHPAIVAVYDTGEEETLSPNGNTYSLPYIVMEYVRGRTVSKLVGGGDALPINEAVQIVVGVLSALEYSHREGIIHRDIKPGNIMLTPEGKVKVMDFGIARAVADSSATMTSTNSVVGTAQYLSPEQARGEVVDARSDLYSTGCVLYELLTGKPPFQGDSAVAVAYQHVSEPPKPASSIAPDIPDVLDRVVMKSLAKKREDRYQSAAEMRSELLAAIRGQGVGAPAVTTWAQRTPPVPAPTSAPTQTMAAAELTNTTTSATPVAAAPANNSKRSVAYIVLGVVLLALAIGGIVWAVSRSGSDPAPTPTASVAQQVAVPDLSNMDQTEARRALEAVGLKMTIGKAVEDQKVEAGKFVSSSPAIGENVAKGSTVEVIFSLGVGDVKVPDVTSGTMPQDEARATLEAAGLKVNRVDARNTPGVARDLVVETDPAAGSSVKRGSEVNLVVASGQVDLSDVRNLPKDKAMAVLRDELKIRQITVVEETNPTVEPGTVIGMTPGPGQQPYDVSVELIVAVAPEQQSTPEPDPQASTPDAPAPQPSPSSTK
ncbi:serine/threonine-protein kinase [Arcanobacterium wilhelmae]|uniref:non-specific serine/threonine protein kinase n=1 Tax=Arcanobacterium wilhelmae TaxID=1803177 RepID=A0ABT9NB77_9ACTO|nr:Stk1 family PASTA domain-containing Ser/Thr kinase [Arcanobacterium wilhelmae]MDP9800951.1 serine/threonine-protein kinase [Arcanobacterium wilhelmae]WFN90311.1 Stk1 family PASTA domain-containing Ser/Thr kinase [Arcanobacterium wilhelmae]